MSTISSYNIDDPYESLIQSILTIERQPKLRLVEQRTEQERLKGVLGDFESKLSALRTSVRKFTDQLTSLFSAKAATVSGTGISVSAGDRATIGAHSIQVNRLASTDTRLSKRILASETTLSSSLGGTTQTFQIGVATSNPDIPSGRYLVDVTVDVTAGASDQEVLQQISDAVDAAMDTAVASGSIRSTERASLSMINEADGNLRLSLRSGQTGYTNRLELQDSAGGLLSMLELNNMQLAAGTSGGYVTEIGTSPFDSKLNSEFILDGLTLYRDGNVVRDALEGTTITLTQPGTIPAGFSVTTDSENIKKEVEDFISKYNDLLSYIEKKAAVDPDAGTRGDFAGDYTIRSLRSNLRDDISRPVTGQSADAPSMLTQLGITIEKNGTLKLSDAEALLAAVEENPDAVNALFGGTDGIATRVENRLNAFLDNNGILDEREKSIETRIKRFKDRETEMESRLKMREEQLRAQFAAFQETIALLQGQQQMLFGYMTY